MVERIAGLSQSGEKLTEAWRAGVLEWKDTSSWVQKRPEFQPDGLYISKQKSEITAGFLLCFCLLY